MAGAAIAESGRAAPLAAQAPEGGCTADQPPAESGRAAALAMENVEGGRAAALVMENVEGGRAFDVGCTAAPLAADESVDGC